MVKFHTRRRKKALHFREFLPKNREILFTPYSLYMFLDVFLTNSSLTFWLALSFNLANQSIVSVKKQRYLNETFVVQTYPYFVVVFAVVLGYDNVDNVFETIDGK